MLADLQLRSLYSQIAVGALRPQLLYCRRMRRSATPALPFNSVSVVAALLLAGLFSSCAAPVSYDLILRNGTLYDGSGSDPFQDDLAIQDDVIVGLGGLE